MIGIRFILFIAVIIISTFAGDNSYALKDMGFKQIDMAVNGNVALNYIKKRERTIISSSADVLDCPIGCGLSRLWFLSHLRSLRSLR